MRDLTYYISCVPLFFIVSLWDRFFLFHLLFNTCNDSCVFLQQCIFFSAKHPVFLGTSSWVSLQQYVFFPGRHSVLPGTCSCVELIQSWMIWNKFFINNSSVLVLNDVFILSSSDKTDSLLMFNSAVEKKNQFFLFWIFLGLFFHSH